MLSKAPRLRPGWDPLIGDVDVSARRVHRPSFNLSREAKADPARYDDWIDQATVWLQRAIQARHGKAVTYDIQDGRMIPARADIDFDVARTCSKERV